MSRLEFSKRGKAIYISHLDLMRTMGRAFLRAGLPICFSEGFNPHANISIALPLPLGHESSCELMDFAFQEPTCAIEALGRLNRALPEGIQAKRIYESKRPFKEIEYLKHRLELVYDCGVPDGAEKALSALFSQDEISVLRKTKTSMGEFNIATCIKELHITQPEGKIITCEAALTAMRPMLNPTYLILAIERFLPALKPSFVRFGRVALMDAQMCKFE